MLLHHLLHLERRNGKKRYPKDCNKIQTLMKMMLGKKLMMLGRKRGICEIQKPAKLCALIRYEDSKNKQGILKRVDKFVNKIPKEDKKNRQGILQHVDEFINKILKADKKNKQGILQRVNELG